MAVKIRPSAKVGLLALVTIGAVWASTIVYSNLRLSGFNPKRVEPGRVNLIALPREAGYRVIVSNGIAHLAQMSDSQGLDVPDNDQQVERNAARLPIRELLLSLTGDSAALGKLTMSVNKMGEDAIPPNPVIWSMEDLEKALGGDSTLSKRLESDLLLTLDGRPLGEFTIGAIQSGIVLDIPVPVKVPVGESTKTIVARVLEPFRTEFATRVESRIAELFNPSRETLAGIYREEAMKITKEASETGRWPDVAGMLRSRYSESRLRGLAEIPERLLKMIDVVVSDAHLTGAKFNAYEGPNRSRLSDVKLSVTEDGRMRLWKYSHKNQGFQLLLTVDGVAIAAPRIRTELAEREVTLTRLPTEVLVSDAVDLINQTVSERKSS